MGSWQQPDWSEGACRDCLRVVPMPSVSYGNLIRVVGICKGVVATRARRCGRPERGWRRCRQRVGRGASAPPARSARRSTSSQRKVKISLLRQPVSISSRNAATTPGGTLPSASPSTPPGAGTSDRKLHSSGIFPMAGILIISRSKYALKNSSPAAGHSPGVDEQWRNAPHRSLGDRH